MNLLFKLLSRQSEPPDSALHFMAKPIYTRMPQQSEYSNYTKADNPLKIQSRPVVPKGLPNPIKSNSPSTPSQLSPSMVSSQQQNKSINAKVDIFADPFYKFGSFNEDNSPLATTFPRQIFSYPNSFSIPSSSPIADTTNFQTTSKSSIIDNITNPSLPHKSFDDGKSALPSPPTPFRLSSNKNLIPPPIPEKIKSLENDKPLLPSPYISHPIQRRKSLYELSGQKAPPLPMKPQTAVSSNHQGRFPLLLNPTTDQIGFSQVAMLGDMGGGGIAGLRNLGNTCFLNSTIQCLISTTPLVRLFMSKNFTMILVLLCIFYIL